MSGLALRETGGLREVSGGEGGIRTLDRGLSPYSGLANRRPQPLGDFSAFVCRQAGDYNRMSIADADNGFQAELRASLFKPRIGNRRVDGHWDAPDEFARSDHHFMFHDQLAPLGIVFVYLYNNLIVDAVYGPGTQRLERL